MTKYSIIYIIFGMTFSDGRQSGDNKNNGGSSLSDADLQGR